MVFLQTALLVVLAIPLAIYLLYKKKFRFWKNIGVAYTSRQSIPWGSIKGFGIKQTIGEVVSDLYKEFPNEKFTGFWIFYTPHLLVRDPELIKSIFVKDFLSFYDRGIKIDKNVDPLSDHLITIEGSRWKKMRITLTPTFTSGKIKTMLPIMNECSQLFAEVLKEPAKTGQVIEVRDYAARFTTDIIASVAFGLDTKSLLNPDSEFRRYGIRTSEPGAMQNLKNTLANAAPEIARFFRMKRVEQDIEDFYMTIVRDTISYRKENNIRRNDFLDLLIQLMEKGHLEGEDSNIGKESGVTKMSFQEAAAQAFVFFIAGFETSSTTMQYVLYELSKNPEIQKKTRDEILTVLQKHGGEMTYEAIMEMPYLANVIDEALRMYPPVPFLLRECNKEYKISGTNVTIPKGAEVIVPVLGLHYDPQYYPNPEVFNPDRFTEEGKSTRHHYSYLPFGEGPRNCIGMRFGLLQTKAGIITLLRNYEFHVAAETQIPIKFDPKVFILTPHGGMNLKITELRN